MTVTIVFGKTSDAYLHSNDGSYNTAKNGPADSVITGSNLLTGQNNNAGEYSVFEALVGVDYTAIPATEVVTAAELRVYVTRQVNRTLNPDLEWRSYGWSGGGVTTGDWRTPAQLAAARLDGVVHLRSSADGNFVCGSTDEFLATMRAATTMEHVVVTSRQRSGTTPTSDEGIFLAAADTAGTITDPHMVYTSVPRHALFGVLAAQARVSDGWVYLESNGAAVPTITIKHRSTSNVVTSVATLPIGTVAGTFQPPEGAQGIALVVDPDDNIFIIGRAGGTKNSIAMLPFKRGGGVTYTQKSMKTAAMPAYGQSINQVVAAYHDYYGGTILVFVEHIGSTGDAEKHWEMSHAFISPTVLLDNITLNVYPPPTVVRGVDYSIPSLQPMESASGYFNTWHNQTGSGMDVVPASMSGISGADVLQGYVYSWGTRQNLGDNRPLSAGRYIVSTTGSAFTFTSAYPIAAFGRKDAGGKLRAVPISAGMVAFVSADSDSAYGITVCVESHSGTNPGSTNVAYIALAGESIASMPDGPAVGQVSTWDAIYSPAENYLWVYYLSVSNPRQIMRTAVNLTTMQAVRSEVAVATVAVGTAIDAVRVERNAGIQQSVLVSYATNTAGVLATAYTIDSFNVAPTAPTLTMKPNFDATSAQTFSWTFNDPNVGDTQSAYQLEISRVSDGVIVLDTGKVASTVSSRNIAGGTITNGADYRWRVKTWDALDAAGPYSGYGIFTASAGGSVTITNPPADYPTGIVTDDLPITWSVTGTVQAAYRVWLYRGATLVSDTNWVASATTTATVTGMLSDQTHEIRVQVRNASAVTTNTASRFLIPSFSTPEAPVLSIQANPGAGYVSIVIDNPTPGAPALGLPEWGFEDPDGVTGWTATGCTVVQDKTVFHRGLASMLLTVVGAPASAYARNLVSPATVVPGQRYTARMWLYSPTGGSVGAGIDWRNSVSGYVSTSAITVAIPAAEWTNVQVTGTCPVGADRAIYGPTLPGNPATGVKLYADEVVLAAASDRPDVTSNSILRRVSGSTGAWEVIGSVGPDGTCRDYTATAGVTYEYRARGNA